MTGLSLAVKPQREAFLWMFWASGVVASAVEYQVCRSDIHYQPPDKTDLHKKLRLKISGGNITLGAECTVSKGGSSTMVGVRV